MPDVLRIQAVGVMLASHAYRGYNSPCLRSLSECAAWPLSAGDRRPHVSWRARDAGGAVRTARGGERIPDLRVFPLERQVCLLGASSSVDVFIDNSYVSRMHAQIVEEADGHRIRDLDSKNGTLVNGARVASGGRLLVSGDRTGLAEGRWSCAFSCGASRSRTTRPRLLPTRRSPSLDGRSARGER